ncbi:MAG: acyltransferase family protein [Anaerotignaceae bacterium]|nr:acyltransferase family protein [Eubacterium sp.]
MVSYSWYVAVILIFYLAFYIIFKFSRNIKHGILIFLIFNLIYMIIAKIIVQQRYIFWSSYCFSLGLIYSYKIKDINLFIKNINYKLLFLVATIIFILYLILNFKLNFNGPLETLYTLGLPAIFTIWFLLFFSIFNFGNKFNEFLGKISYEIYLLQGLVFTLLKSYFHIENDLIFIIFSLIIITILSIIINYVYKLVFSKLIIFLK